MSRIDSLLTRTNGNRNPLSIWIATGFYWVSIVTKQYVFQRNHKFIEPRLVKIWRHGGFWLTIHRFWTYIFSRNANRMSWTILCLIKIIFLRSNVFITQSDSQFKNWSTDFHSVCMFRKDPISFYVSIFSDFFSLPFCVVNSKINLSISRPKNCRVINNEKGIPF